MVTLPVSHALVISHPGYLTVYDSRFMANAIKNFHIFLGTLPFSHSLVISGFGRRSAWPRTEHASWAPASERGTPAASLLDSATVAWAASALVWAILAILVLAILWQVLSAIRCRGKLSPLPARWTCGTRAIKALGESLPLSVLFFPVAICFFSVALYIVGKCTAPAAQLHSLLYGGAHLLQLASRGTKIELEWSQRQAVKDGRTPRPKKFHTRPTIMCPVREVKNR